MSGRVLRAVRALALVVIGLVAALGAGSAAFTTRAAPVTAYVPPTDPPAVTAPVSVIPVPTPTPASPSPSVSPDPTAKPSPRPSITTTPTPAPTPVPATGVAVSQQLS